MHIDLTDEEWAIILPLLPRRIRGPERVDDRKILNSIFCARARPGVWRDIFEALAQNNEDSLLFIDASIVKAHRAATGVKGGLAQDIGSGRSRKAHAVVDEKCQLIRAVITGGQVHDSQAIPALFEPNLNAPLAVIPSKSNANIPIPHDPNLYAMCNIVERFFC